MINHCFRNLLNLVLLLSKESHFRTSIGARTTEPVTISVLFSGSCIIKGEIRKSIREQRNRRILVLIIDDNHRKSSIRPMDIVSIRHEISSNKRKVSDEIRKVFRFSTSSGGRGTRR